MIINTKKVCYCISWSHLLCHLRDISITPLHETLSVVQKSEPTGDFMRHSCSLTWGAVYSGKSQITSKPQSAYAWQSQPRKRKGFPSQEENCRYDTFGGDWLVHMPFLWPACPHQWGDTCPLQPQPCLLSTGTKVGIWASWANLFLFWAFVIGAQRSLFLMLTFKLRSVWELGWGSLLLPCVHTEQRKLVCGQVRRHISSPRGKVHTTWLQTSPFLVPSQLHFLPSGSMGHPSIPAVNFSPWLQLDWTGSCSSQPNKHSIKTPCAAQPWLRWPGGGEERPGARSQSQGGRPSRHTQRKCKAGTLS